MDDETATDASPSQRILGAALRAIRQARRLRAAEVALAMGMHPRSYQRLERGESPFDLDQIKAFAKITDSDPFAILASVWMETPEFAVRAMDTKPLVVFTLALRSFQEDLGDDIGLIEPRVWWGGFRRVFQDLADHVRKRDFTAETWLEEQARRLGLDARFLPQRPPRRTR